MIFTVLDEACTPMIATEFSAGIDLKASGLTTLRAKDVTIIKLGVKINLDYLRELKLTRKQVKSLYISLHIRSSLSVKYGLIQANGVGIIDIDYPDELGLIVYNPTNNNINIEKGERVAQAIVTSTKHNQLLLNKIYGTTTKRVGGYGSTNK